MAEWSSGIVEDCAVRQDGHYGGVEFGRCGGLCG